MDGLESFSRFGAPASTLFAGTSYGIDGAGGSVHGFTGSDTSYGIDDGVGCGGDCYFGDGASVSSGSGLSSDSSDPEEEDDRDEMDGTVNLDAAEDLVDTTCLDAQRIQIRSSGRRQGAAFVVFQGTDQTHASLGSLS